MSPTAGMMRTVALVEIASWIATSTSRPPVDVLGRDRVDAPLVVGVVVHQQRLHPPVGQR